MLSLLVVPVAVLCAVSTVLVLRSRLVVVTVRGDSMAPTYSDGERVVVVRGAGASVGDVVVLAGQPPAPYWLIKRVAAAPGGPVPRSRVPALAHVPEQNVPRGKLVLLGDNPDVSLDSRTLGYFPSGQLLGRVIGSRVGRFTELTG